MALIVFVMQLAMANPHDKYQLCLMEAIILLVKVASWMGTSTICSFSLEATYHDHAVQHSVQA